MLFIIFLLTSLEQPLWHIASWSLYQSAPVRWRVTSGQTGWDFHWCIYFCIFVEKAKYSIILIKMVSLESKTSSFHLNGLLILVFPLLSLAPSYSTANVVPVTSFPRLSIKSFFLSPIKYFKECFPNCSFKGI